MVIMEDPREVKFGFKLSAKQNITHEASRKLKLRMKVRRALKFLLNFLQIRKPKRKNADAEKSCQNHHVQDVLFNNEGWSALHPSPTQCVPDRAPQLTQISNNGLSRSWSYLIHSPFDVTSNQEKCSDVDETRGGVEIYYNESYFEDDYWQDYRSYENLSVTSPFRRDIQRANGNSFRLFEPERTPYGEMKRHITSGKLLRRRHASMPNLLEDMQELDIQPVNVQEFSICNITNEAGNITDDLMDYQQLMSSHPPLGLNIAFDSQPDDTVTCHDRQNIQEQISVSVLVVSSISENLVGSQPDSQCEGKYMDIHVSESQKPSHSSNSPAFSDSEDGNNQSGSTYFASEASETIIEASSQHSDLFFEGHVSSDCRIGPLIKAAVDSDETRCNFECHTFSTPDSSYSACKSKSVTAGLALSCPEITVERQSSIEPGYDNLDSVPLAAVSLNQPDFKADLDDCSIEGVPETCSIEDPQKLFDGGQESIKCDLVHQLISALTLQGSPLSDLLNLSKKVLSPVSTSSPLQMLRASSQWGCRVLTSFHSFISPIRRTSVKHRSKLYIKDVEETPTRNRCLKYFTEDGRHLNFRLKLFDMNNNPTITDDPGSTLLDVNSNMATACDPDPLVSENSNPITAFDPDPFVNNHNSVTAGDPRLDVNGNPIALRGPRLPSLALNSSVITSDSRSSVLMSSPVIVSDLRPSHFDVSSSSAIAVSDVTGPSMRDCLLLKKAANFIINRIPHKKEIQHYANKSHLLDYLKSHYQKEINQFSGKKIKTVSDYIKFKKEACDTFTSDRLTLGNCFSELLVAVLANRKGVVSLCENFLFENLREFVSSQDYHLAPPELVVMLLCNGCCSVLSPSGFPLSREESQREVMRALTVYIKMHQMDSLENLRVNRLLSSVIDIRAISKMRYKEVQNNNLANSGFKRPHKIVNQFPGKSVTLFSKRSSDFPDYFISVRKQRPGSLPAMNQISKFHTRVKFRQRQDSSRSWAALKTHQPVPRLAVPTCVNRKTLIPVLKSRIKLTLAVKVAGSEKAKRASLGVDSDLQCCSHHSD